MSMISLKTCYHDHPLLRVNQAADHLISRLPGSNPLQGCANLSATRLDPGPTSSLDFVGRIVNALRAIDIDLLVLL
jgi:hypothetical protein